MPLWQAPSTARRQTKRVLGPNRGRLRHALTSGKQPLTAGRCICPSHTRPDDAPTDKQGGADGGVVCAGGVRGVDGVGGVAGVAAAAATAVGVAAATVPLAGTAAAERRRPPAHHHPLLTAAMTGSAAAVAATPQSAAAVPTWADRGPGDTRVLASCKDPTATSEARAAFMTPLRMTRAF